MNHIILYPTDSGVSVVIPTGELSIEKVIEKDVPTLDYKILSIEELPDTYFRDAWRYDSEAGVIVDIPAAQEVQRNIWRTFRGPKLTALDLEFMRAVEMGDTKKQSEISAHKQALRDVTKTELPNDLDGIKSTFPDILL
jgi:hypothetical protein